MTRITTGFLPIDAPPIGEHNAVRGLHVLLSQPTRLSGGALDALSASLARLEEAWRGPQPTLEHPTWSLERQRGLYDLERIDLVLRAGLGDDPNLTGNELIAHLDRLELFSEQWRSDSITLVMAVAVCGHPRLAAKIAQEDFRGYEPQRPWADWLMGEDVAPDRLAQYVFGVPAQALAVRAEWRTLDEVCRRELGRTIDWDEPDPDADLDRPLYELLSALAQLRSNDGSAHAVEVAFRRWIAGPPDDRREPLLTLLPKVPAMYLYARELGGGGPTDVVAGLRPLVRGLEPPVSPTFEIEEVARLRVRELVALTRDARARDAAIASSVTTLGVDFAVVPERS